VSFFSGGQTQEQRLQSTGPGDVANQNLARRIKLVQDAAPIFGQGDGVKFATQLASSPFDDNELVRHATAAGGDILVKAYIEHLKGIQDPWKQQQAFKAFDEGQQRLIRKAGYVPPEAMEPDITELGIVKKMAGDFVHDVTHVVGVKQLLQGLDYVGGIGTHLYRAGRLGGEEEGVFGMGGSLNEAEIQDRRATPLAVYRDFKDLWKRTNDGENNFTEKSKDRVRRVMGGDADKFEFVSELAKGKTISDYLTDNLQLTPDTPLFEEQLSKYSQYQNQDDIQDAVKDLRNNKVSPGRDFAKVFTPFKDGTTPFNIVSGGIDGTFRVLTDPTIVGGEMAQSARLARYGLEAKTVAAAAEGLDAAEMTQRVNYLSTLPRFQRAADAIAEGLNTGRVGELLDRLPQLRGGGLHDMAQYFAKRGMSLEDLNREHIFDYFRSTSGAKALNEGKFAAPHFPGTVLPSLTRGEEFRSGLTLGIKDWVSQFRLEDYGFDALEPSQLAELFNVRQRAAISLKGAVGDAIHSMYTLVPKYDYMGPDDSHSLTQFRAVLEYALPGHLRDDYLNEWLKTTDVTARRGIYEAGVQSMFHYSGALQTEEGKSLLQKILGRTQSYAGEGLDRLGNRPVGIGEADLAEYWGIPDFKEMLKVTAETTKYRKWLDGTNEGMINGFMSKYWKPAVLLKAGFIPRAYGEEFLGFMLREGPSAWIKSQAAITATREGYILPMRPVGWIADSLLSHIPLTSVSDPLEVFAHNMAGSVSTFTRKWAERMAPEEYLAAVRSLAYQGGGVHGAVAQLGTNLGEVATPIGERLKTEVIGQRVPGSTEITYVPVQHGEFTTHIKGPALSGFYPHTVLREMRRMQTDRVYAGMIDAGRRQLTLEEGNQITDLFRGAGLISERGQGLDYVSDLKKMRELVPDEVMPNFERWLRHDSHASIQSVLDDLTGAGMELDDARQLRNTIENLDTRQRVAIFTRDGEIEKIYRPHILDPNAAFDVESDLPRIRQHVEDEARKEYEDVLATLWGPGSSNDAYWKLTRRRLNSADMSDAVRKSYRSGRTLDDRPVATAPVKGTRRVYTVVMDKDPVTAFEDLGHTQPVGTARALENPTPQLARTNTVIDTENGYIPFQSGEIYGLSPNHEPNLNLLEDLPEGEALTPEEMAWFTQDYAHAADIHNGLKAKYKTQPVSIGYVDVPEDVFQEGQRLAKANVSGGLDPLAQANAANQVWIPKSWREKYKVLADDNFQMIDGVPAVGAARHEAIDDWAYVAARRYSQVFESKNPHALRELQHKLLENRINVNDVFDHAPYLADSSIGASILEPSRTNWFKDLVTRGFDAIGEGGNAMIRNQMYLHYYAQRLKTETDVMMRLLGAEGTHDTIKNFSERLGVRHYQLASDWKSLPLEVRNSVDPVAAMIARDPIPPSLRSLIDVEDQKKFAEAFTAFYEHQNSDLLPEVEKLWQDKYVQKLGVEGYSFRDIQDSYLSLNDELRTSIRDNGYPPQIPKAFENADLDADEWTQLRDALDRNSEVYRMAHLKAEKGAIEDTIPWIDDHRVRSQFQQHGRNLIPFWFAQENFIKRTINNVYRDPTAIRKAQLAMDALRNSGVVTQNQFGEDVFNIPMTGIMTKAVTNGLEKISGGRFKVSFPTVSPMTGQLKYVIPGLDTLDRIGPSVSPMMGLPLEAVTRIFPELNAAKRAIVGERGVTDDNAVDLILKSIMPSWAGKMYEALAKDVDSDSEYASSMIQTSQMLQVKTEEIMDEAKGLDPVKDAAKIKEIRDRANKYGLTEDADEYEQKDYRHRLENFTRMQMFLRGAVGFFSPAAPSTAPIDEFTPEFNKLLHDNRLPMGEAFMEFMAQHPDARAYTIVKTDVPSKAPLSSSEEAGLLLDKNKEYFEKYSMAGPWLLPQSDDDTGFSYQTYNDEIGMELRKRKSVKEWYDDYFFASAADTYFNNKDDYELRMAAAKGNPQLRAQYTEQYQVWKKEYLDEHKVFGRLLNDPDAQQRRQQVLDQMEEALDDPHAPDALHKDQLRTLVTNYKSYLDNKSQYKRNTNAERQVKERMTDQFALWVRGYVDKNPQVKAFYNRIIRPELGID